MLCGGLDPNPYRAEIQRSTCKACGREIVQIGGGHRQRAYCDDNCKQAAFRARREQEHRGEVNRRWQAFTPETRSFLDWITGRYGDDLAASIEAALNREKQQQPLALDEALLAIGKKRNFPEIHFALPNGTQAKVRSGEQSWRSFSQNAEYRLVRRVFEVASQS
jgi:hypothetical protein